MRMQPLLYIVCAAILLAISPAVQPQEPPEAGEMGDLGGPAEPAAPAGEEPGAPGAEPGPPEEAGPPGEGAGAPSEGPAVAPGELPSRSEILASLEPEDLGHYYGWAIRRLKAEGLIAAARARRTVVRQERWGENEAEYLRAVGCRSRDELAFWRGVQASLTGQSDALLTDEQREQVLQLALVSPEDHDAAIRLCEDAAHECRVYRYADRLHWDATNGYEAYSPLTYEQRLDYHLRATTALRGTLEPIAVRYREALLTDPGSEEALAGFQNIAGMADARAYAAGAARASDRTSMNVAGITVRTPGGGALEIGWTGEVSDAASLMEATFRTHDLAAMPTAFARDAAALLGGVAYAASVSGSLGAIPGPFHMGSSEYWDSIADIYARYVGI